MEPDRMGGWFFDHHSSCFSLTDVLGQTRSERCSSAAVSGV
ncbi:hypothetical protein MCEMIEM12_01327 [Burkholderiaceae bacterium]